MSGAGVVWKGIGLRAALLAGAGALAGGSVAGCGNKNTGGFADDEEGGSADDDAASSGGGSSGSKPSSSGSGSGSSSRDSGSSSGDQRVASNVQFNDAGVVLCGTPCPLTSNQCCIDVLGNTTCTSPGASCTNEAIFKCVQQTDCPANQVCCGVANQSAATAGSECQDVASTGNQCAPVATSASSTEGSAQICQTDAECITGSCIWQDCSVGTLKPSLTMCGLQSAAPFNCVAHQ
jgi:hypothetical protein